MKERVFLIHWRGPFTDAQLAEMDESGVLYLAVGRVECQRRDEIQYCGITEQSICYRIMRHSKLSQITSNRQIWVGWIMSHRTTRAVLEAAESLLVYLWQPSLNERKTVHPPKPTTLISHWFKHDWKPYSQKPDVFKDLFDVICWDGEYWRVGQLDRWKN
jgi:hypothetical protein